MSSCLIIQQKNRLFIGADSAISVKHINKYIRCSNNGKKLFKIKNEIVFASGNIEVVNKAIDFYKEESNLLLFQNKLRQLCKNSKSDSYNVEILISGIKDNNSYVYQLSQYNNFSPIVHHVDNDNINVLCGGICTNELNNNVSKKINSGIELHDIFKSSYKDISNENIGGNLTVYEINSNGISLFMNEEIDEYINPIIINKISEYHLVCADKLVGNMMISKSLVIANDSGTYTITDDGMLAKNGSYEVKINPNEPDEIFAISIDGNKLLYIDADSKKLKFEGDIESISGHIGGYTIGSKDLTSGGVGMSSDTASNAVAFWAGNSNRNSAAFRVTNTGNLTCSNANITGGTIRIGDRFSVDANGNLVNFQLTAESNRITNEIDRAQKVEAQLRMDVNENAAQILLRVQKDQLISEINTGIDGTGAYIHFKTGSLVIDSTNFKLDRNGNAEFKGSIKSGSTITGSRISASIFESDLFYADDSEIYLGDFGVTDNYGRHIFQSTDEVTGMSTGDVEKGNLYLWAGYGVSPHHTEEAVFLVNTGQVRCGGDLYVQGVNILEAIRDIGGGGGCDCDSYTCDGDACGGGDECGAAYTGGCSSNDPCSSDSCTCDGSYDVPGCQVVSPCTTDS